MTSTPEGTINRRRIIFILGCLTALSPFSIDMYLPAFPQIAGEFHTLVARVSLSLSSYFIGLSIGQLVYGPLLDRYGRKRPLYVGLGLYFLACFGCVSARSNEALVAWRFVQAAGGCVAGVAPMAVVRDLFDTGSSAKVYAILILILGTSPLFAPTLGGYLAGALGWRAVFGVLAALAAGLLVAVHFGLPETHAPDVDVELRPGPIARSFALIAQDARFYTYVVAGGFAFSGLFVYLAGSTIIFMDHYGVSEQVFGWIFAAIAVGMIGASQFNSTLLKRFTSEQILLSTVSAQVAFALIFTVGVATGVFGLYLTIAMLFLIVACLGLSNPNSAALALEPFSRDAGRASALMGFFQMGLGALTSMFVAVLGIHTVLPVVEILAATSMIALVVLLLGRRKIAQLGPHLEAAVTTRFEKNPREVEA